MQLRVFTLIATSSSLSFAQIVSWELSNLQQRQTRLNFFVRHRARDSSTEGEASDECPSLVKASRPDLIFAQPGVTTSEETADTKQCAHILVRCSCRYRSESERERKRLISSFDGANSRNLWARAEQHL
jgi:hypothetical protein